MKGRRGHCWARLDQRAEETLSRPIRFTEKFSKLRPRRREGTDARRKRIEGGGGNKQSGAVQETYEKSYMSPAGEREEIFLRTFGKNSLLSPGRKWVRYASCGVERQPGISFCKRGVLFEVHQSKGTHVIFCFWLVKRGRKERKNIWLGKTPRNFSTEGQKKSRGIISRHDPYSALIMILRNARRREPGEGGLACPATVGRFPSKNQPEKPAPLVAARWQPLKGRRGKSRDLGHLRYRRDLTRAQSIISL